MSMKPRVAFVGLGWIGRHRMESILDLVDPVAVADTSPESRIDAARLAPGALVVETLDEALATRPDGVVIATPSALHAEQTIAALEAGCAVFCQKPLGRNEGEARRVIDAAQRANRLLHVDFSYRGTAALQAIRQGIQDGALGTVFAVDMIFHNAYGPDKPWFYDKRQSGGGPLMDLGVHLVDAAMWCLGFPKTRCISANVHRAGSPIIRDTETEDYASASLATDTGAGIRVACSWNAHAGRDAVIEMKFLGTKGGASLKNPAGDFYDFEAWMHKGTRSWRLSAPPDPWSVSMIRAWADRLSADGSFDRAAEDYIVTSRLIAQIYATASRLNIIPGTAVG